MKRCPVCKTTLFDDMETCYGCMYQFGSNPNLEAKADAEAALSGRAVEKAEQEAGECLFNHFLVDFERFLRDFLVYRHVEIE